MSFSAIEVQIRDLGENINQLIVLTDELIETLDGLADEVDKCFKKVTITKVTGSACAIFGGVLGIVGFGLSFVTFGTSLGLCIAGGVVAGSGGGAVGIARITDAICNSKRGREANNAIERYNRHIQTIQEKARDIGEELTRIGEIDTDFASWVLAYGSASTGLGIGWRLIVNTILRGLDVAEGIGRTGLEAGVTAFRALGTVGKVFHIGGGVAGIIFLPVDIYTLVDSSIDIHKDNKHKVSRNIRSTISTLRESSPTKESVDTFIAEILRIQASRYNNVQTGI